MRERAHEDVTVPVPGGDLAVTDWQAAGPPVLAVHGITSNGLSWSAVAASLPEHRVLAPDLRGRGASRTLPGPYGLARHAEDAVAVLDGLGITDPVVLTGHSMGAFVACLAASRHPERFSSIVLVDGGFGFTPPEGTDLDAVLHATLGPAMARLSTTFAGRDEYYDFWRAHPAFENMWDGCVRAYVDRDLVGEPPELHPSCVPEAVRADGADVLADPEALAAIRKLPQPTTLLLAERGLQNEPGGLYPPRTVAAAGLPPAVEVHRVPDTNHYSIALSEHGAAAVAEAIRAASQAG